MSIARKEARLSGMLLARKGTAHPAHTDHRLNIQAMEAELSSDFHEDIITQQTDTSILVEAVKEINKVTKQQYNNAVMEEEKAVKAHRKTQPEVQKKEQAVKRVSESSPVVKNNVTPVENKVTAKKRIAMTLRMEQDEHLKLRLYAAHSRKSCQEIISEALKMYLAEDKTICSLSDCNCLTRK